MNKRQRRYKNLLEMFLASEKGKRILNFCYSWGAAVVIIGALFKILHFPFGDQMLFAGMMTEFFVFFISGFEKPMNDYNWEEVFPVLKSKNPMDRPNFATGENGGGEMQQKGAAQGSQNFGVTSTSSLSDQDVKGLSESIDRLNTASEQIGKISDITEVTNNYIQQMQSVSENMKVFNEATGSLAAASNTLLESYKTISDNSEGIGQNSRGYVEQMDLLNRNISGLNTIYEIQLKSISSQIDTIERINGGLNRVKDLYEGSMADSSIFRNETEKLARQLSQLNDVYARLLQAMTVNMHPTTSASNLGFGGNQENHLGEIR